jgi:hypothetical protein
MRAWLYLIAGAMPSAIAAAQTAGTNPAYMAVRPGSWAYAPSQTGSEASFVDASGAAQLTLRCVRANRSVVLSVRGAQASPLSVWTSSVSRSLPATFDATTSRINASVAAADPLLDAIAFSRGRFAFSTTGVSPVVVPAWPEPARAIEDCRN